MLTVTADKTQQEAHHEYHSVQTICSEQRRLWTAMLYNRASNHKGQHGADGSAGEDEVNQFWGRHFVCCEPRVMMVV